MNKRPLFAPALALASILSLAACGGGSGASDATIPADADVVVLAKDGNLFDAASYTAAAGEVTLAYDGQSSIAHTLQILDASGKQIGEKLKVSMGDVVVGKFELAAGTYAVVCDIPGHDSMKAELVVS
jgi:plastocyanin